MNNVLIVDDEPIIAQGVFNVLYEVSGLDLNLWKAYSVREAIKILEQNRIDILVTDIRMPEMSGLELTKVVHDRWKKCKVIFLSGYSDVEYLQFALRQGVFDFLSKPLDDSELIEVLRKVILAIDQEAETYNFLDKARMQFRQAQPLLRREFLNSLFNDDKRLLKNITEQVNLLQIPLNIGNPVILMLGRVDHWEDGTSTEDRLLFQFAIDNILEEYLADRCDMLPYTEGNYIVWLMQLRENMSNLSNDACDSYIYITEMLEKVQETVKNILKIKFSIVLSRPCLKWEELHIVHKELYGLLQKGIGLEEEIIIVDKEDTSSTRKIDSYSREASKQVSNLAVLLESGDETNFLNEINEFLSIAQKFVYVDYSIQIQIFCSLAAMFLSYMNIRRITDKVASRISLERLSNFTEFSSWNDIKQYYKELTKAIFECNKNEIEIQKNDIVDKADYFINNNLSGDLSLTNLAKQVNISPFYLSRLYQKQKGYNLSQTIIELKVAKAKQLLSQNEMKINEIAQALGFENIPYFTKFFKKRVGTTPQDYKNSNRI